MRCKEPRRETSQSKIKEPDKKTGPNKKNKQTEEDICYRCGQKGHKKRDLKCLKNTVPKNAATQMYTAREILEEDSADGQDQDDEEVSVENNESQNEEDEDPYYGSQYTSEGEEVKVDDFEDLGWSDAGHSTVRMHMLRTKDIDEVASMELNGEEIQSSREDEFPLLVEVNDKDKDEPFEEVIFKQEAFIALNVGKGTPLQLPHKRISE